MFPFRATRVLGVLAVSLLSALFILPHSVVLAQDQDTDPIGRTDAITTAVPFLMIAPDSRSGAMGETGVAYARGANATHWNFSTLAFTDKEYGFAVNYTPWLRSLGIPDINHAYLPGYYNFGPKGGVVGVAFTFFSLGNIEFTDEGNIRTGEFNPNEWSISAHYSRLLTDNLSVGAGLRYITSTLSGAQSAGGITTQPGRSVAADINLFYTRDFSISSQRGDMPLTFNLGMNISNIGSKMTYTRGNEGDFIPTNLRLGYAIALKLDDYNKLMFTNDFNKLLVPSEGGQSDRNLLEGIFGSFGDAPGGFGEEMREINVQFGLEYEYNELFAVRSGFFYEPESKGNRQFLTLGAGLHFKMLTLDFAYLTSFQQNHPLQNTLRFSLSFDFGEMNNDLIRDKVIRL